VLGSHVPEVVVDDYQALLVLEKTVAAAHDLVAYVQSAKKH